MAVCDRCNQEMTQGVGCTQPTYVIGGREYPRVPFTATRMTAAEWMAMWRRSHPPEQESEWGQWDSEKKARLRCEKYQQTWNICHDCGVPAGTLHHPGCDAELCPACGGQAIGCRCGEEREEDEEEHEEE